jgi:hypothetical protein
MFFNREVSKMLAFFARLSILVTVFLSAVPLSADCGCDLLTSIARDTKRRNCWPNPFLCPERQVTRIPFAIMVNNGWRRQNMLGDFHFEPRTGQLTEAGRLKINWILTAAPEQHRTIYVHVGQSSEETAERIASVQAQVASLVPKNEMPQILQTAIPDTMAPADRVEAIDRMYQTEIPKPKLPDTAPSWRTSGSSSQ